MFDNFIATLNASMSKIVGLVVAMLVANLGVHIINGTLFSLGAAAIGTDLFRTFAITFAASILTVLVLASFDNAK